MLTQFQLLKGWLFVVLSTLLIFFLTRQTFRAQERAQRVSDETAEELKGLQFVEDPSAEKLESAVFGRLKEMGEPMEGPSAVGGTGRREQET